MHIKKYLGGQNHTEQAGTTWHIKELKELQESSQDWYERNDDTRIVDNPAYIYNILYIYNSRQPILYRCKMN